jgi:hypothetical protein
MLSRRRLNDERHTVRKINHTMNGQPRVKGRWSSGFARIGAVAACLAIALMGVGCDTTDSRYFRYGIGTDLYSTDIVATTQLQDVYLTELCRQALPILSSPEPECVNFAPAPATWNLIVQAGLNDVDRRCDSYLAWLDDRRRTNTALLKEIGDITVASQAIMRVSGVGPNPITLAGLAFGLASDTFTNINSRLLLEVDKTTVQTLVLSRRNAYRLDLQKIMVDSRPAAVHALRSYLTICTPFAIETDINSTITVFQIGGAGALDRAPLIDSDTVKGLAIQRARDPLPPRKFGDIKKIPAAFVTNVQLALCVPVVDGVVNDATKSAVLAYLQARQRPVPSVVDPTSTDLRPVLQEAIDDVGDCNTLGFRNGFEVGRYGIPANQREDRIKVLQRKMALLLASKNSTVTATQTGKFDDQTRAAIKEIRRLTTTGAPADAGTSSNELDFKLNRLIQSSS